MNRHRIPFMILILVFLVLNITVCLSQTTNLQDIIYLKTGTILRGTIIEEIQDHSVKIQTIEGSIYTVKQIEILQHAKEPVNEELRTVGSSKVPSESSPKSSSGKLSTKHVRYVFTIKTAYLTGIGNETYKSTPYFSGDPFKNKEYCFSISLINAIEFGQLYSIGINIGIDPYHADDFITIVPVMIDQRFLFGKGKVKPSFELGLGYGISLPDPPGGFNGSSGIGINIGLGSNKSLSVSAQYKMRSYSELIIEEGWYSFGYWSDIYLTRYAHFIGLSTGFSF